MDNYRNQEPFAKNGLYDPRFEHENCGIGAVVNMDGTSDRKVVDSALRIVETLEHRAGKDAEGKTGDGVGILLQISHTYFSKVAKEAGIQIGGKREYGIAMFFFPQTKEKYEKAMQTFEEVLKEEHLEFLGWREVPVDPDVLGTKALDSRHSSRSRTTVKRVWNSTGSCTSPAWYSKSGTAKPMWYPAPAVPLYIKVCFWSNSCVCSTTT